MEAYGLPILRRHCTRRMEWVIQMALMVHEQIGRMNKSNTLILGLNRNEALCCNTVKIKHSRRSGQIFILVTSQNIEAHARSNG